MTGSPEKMNYPDWMGCPEGDEATAESGRQRDGLSGRTGAQSVRKDSNVDRVADCDVGRKDLASTYVLRPRLRIKVVLNFGGDKKERTKGGLIAGKNRGNLSEFNLVPNWGSSYRHRTYKY
jgi:hypothetical protein